MYFICLEENPILLEWGGLGVLVYTFNLPEGESDFYEGIPKGKTQGKSLNVSKEGWRYNILVNQYFHTFDPVW